MQILCHEPVLEQLFCIGETVEPWNLVQDEFEVTAGSWTFVPPVGVLRPPAGPADQ